jgi:hypothetical protein
MSSKSANFPLDYCKKRRLKLLNLGMKERNITTDLILREYYKQLHGSKLDNLDEMGKFLERHKTIRTESGRNKKSE